MAACVSCQWTTTEITHVAVVRVRGSSDYLMSMWNAYEGAAIISCRCGTRTRERRLPHVDVEGVDGVEVEAARPAAVRTGHDADAEKLVEVDARPVEGESTAGQGGQVVVNSRLLKHTQRLIHSCGYWFTDGEWDTEYSWAGRTGSRQRSASETHTATHTQLWLLVY